MSKNQPLICSVVSFFLFFGHIGPVFGADTPEDPSLVIYKKVLSCIPVNISTDFHNEMAKIKENLTQVIQSEKLEEPDSRATFKGALNLWSANIKYQQQAFTHLEGLYISAFLHSLLLPAPVDDEGCLDLTFLNGENSEVKSVRSFSHIPLPEVIHQELAAYTIGQDVPLTQISTLVYRFLCIRESKNKASLYKVKPTVVIVGPTGCGKTSTLEILAKFLDVPLVVGKATEWTPQGYIGKKWIILFNELLDQARSYVAKKNEGHTCTDREMVEAAEKAIIFIDEFDKLAGYGMQSTEGAFYQRVLQELLPVIEGGDITTDDSTQLSTRNMLFIVGGAFVGLNRSSGDTIVPQDLQNYGFPSEMTGRLRNIVEFNPLSKKELLRILKESKSSPYLAQQELYKELYNVKLEIPEESLDLVAEKAFTLGTGARALGTVLDHIMNRYEFKIQEYFDKSLVLKKKDIQEDLKKIGTGTTSQQEARNSMYL